VLRIVKQAKIESDVVTVRILNRDKMLTEEDIIVLNSFSFPMVLLKQKFKRIKRKS
jgi:hypothetical protein